LHRHYNEKHLCGGNPNWWLAENNSLEFVNMIHQW
jgi:hypothetical protein